MRTSRRERRDGRICIGFLLVGGYLHDTFGERDGEFGGGELVVFAEGA